MITRLADQIRRVIQTPTTPVGLSHESQAIKSGIAIESNMIAAAAKRISNRWMSLHSSFQVQLQRGATEMTRVLMALLGAVIICLILASRTTGKGARSPAPGD